MIRRLIEESRLGVPGEIRRIRTAFHEAGHAVVARALGIPIHVATIVPGDKSLGHVLTETLDTTIGRLIGGGETGIRRASAGLEGRIVYLMAGRQAEKMVLGFDHNDRGDRSDNRKILKTVKEWYGWRGPRRMEALKEIRATTDHIVTIDFSKSIKAVARSLLAKNTLAGIEVDRIMRKTKERLSVSRFGLLAE
jgi:ATP-dependent Zn protease